MSEEINISAIVNRYIQIAHYRLRNKTELIMRLFRKYFEFYIVAGF